MRCKFLYFINSKASWTREIHILCSVKLTKIVLYHNVRHQLISAPGPFLLRWRFTSLAKCVTLFSSTSWKLWLVHLWTENGSTYRNANTNKKQTKTCKEANRSMNRVKQKNVQKQKKTCPETKRNMSRNKKKHVQKQTEDHKIKQTKYRSIYVKNVFKDKHLCVLGRTRWKPMSMNWLLSNTPTHHMP